jgi:hypothetical protein
MFYRDYDGHSNLEILFIRESAGRSPREGALPERGADLAQAVRFGKVFDRNDGVAHADKVYRGNAWDGGATSSLPSPVRTGISCNPTPLLSFSKLLCRIADLLSRGAVFLAILFVGQ